MPAFNLNPGSIIASIFVSGFGFVFFKYGRKRNAPIFVIFGIAMMVYPYIITDVYWMLGIGAAMTGFLMYLWKQSF